MKRTIRSVFFIFTMSLIAGMNACARADTPAPSHSPGQSTADGPRTLADVEQLEWFTDGFSFRLHRMAGEPNKIYREELLKVVSSLK